MSFIDKTRHGAQGAKEFIAEKVTYVLYYNELYFTVYRL